MRILKHSLSVCSAVLTGQVCLALFSVFSPVASTFVATLYSESFRLFSLLSLSFLVIALECQSLHGRIMLKGVGDKATRASNLEHSK